jgi:hypothetical protein
MLEFFSQAFWIALQRRFFLAFWLGFGLSLCVLQPVCAASPPKTLNGDACIDHLQQGDILFGRLQKITPR